MSSCSSSLDADGLPGSTCVTSCVTSPCLLQVFNASSDLRERLQHMDEGLEGKFKSIEASDFLLTQEHVGILREWDAVAALLAARQSELRRFGQLLDTLENNRVRRRGSGGTHTTEASGFVSF